MTQPIASPRTPTPARAPSSSARPPAPATAQTDRDAMAEAMAQARKKHGGLSLPLREQAAKGQAATALRADAQPPEVPSHALARWMGSDYLEQDSGGDTRGFAGLALSQNQAPVTVQAPPQLPPPAVDPSGFVQLMAQLWARENGKGAKEVRVQLGTNSWPATGARLVRNAAGALDVEIHFAPHRQPDAAVVDTLRGRFADEGIALGALSVGDGAA